jgi:hypothetical protein
MAKQGVVYLLTGLSHAVRLVVSLWSLRQFYDGPVTIYSTRPESAEIAEYCAADSRLNVSHRTWRDARFSRNSAFLTKLELLDVSPYESTAYFDADTLVTGPIDELLAGLDDEEFHATRFADWVSSGRRISRRLAAWRGLTHDELDPVWISNLVDDALRDRPAVNGGVFACHFRARILKPWQQLASAGWRTFICDEVALQLILHHYPHRLLDCRFNYSPVYAPTSNDVRVWHFHGDKHIRRNERNGVWLSAYKECVRHSIGSLSHWTPCCDRTLAEFLDQERVI